MIINKIDIVLSCSCIHFPLLAAYTKPTIPSPASFSPTLADKVALNTAIYSLEEIAKELGKLVNEET